jgi:predicted transposase YdaD
MSEETINNPHDQLFKEAFSHVENAAAFFQNYLPSELRDRLDFSTLKLAPGSSELLIPAHCRMSSNVFIVIVLR